MSTTQALSQAPKLEAWLAAFTHAHFFQLVSHLCLLTLPFLLTPSSDSWSLTRKKKSPLILLQRCLNWLLFLLWFMLISTLPSLPLNANRGVLILLTMMVATGIQIAMSVLKGFWVPKTIPGMLQMTQHLKNNVYKEGKWFCFVLRRN